MTKRISVKGLTWLFAFIYFASYVTRINFSAIIQEFATDTGIEKTVLSSILVCLSITYGVGQIINGWLGDKIKPQLLIFCGLASATVINLLFPFISFSVPLMCVFWGVNGFAQAMMWPPMVKILVGSMNEEEYGNSVIKIFCGSSFGTIFVYLIAPLIIKLWSWKGVFIACATIGIIACIVWYLMQEKTVVTETEAEVENTKTSIPAPFKFPKEAVFPIVFIMIAISFQGMLRDGVTSWMPTYLAEVFEMDNAMSILSTVSIAIFTTISYFVTGWMYKKFFRTEVACGIALYGVVLFFTALQYILYDFGAGIAIVCMTMTTSAIHGVNLMLVSHVPKRFKKYGNISTISGVLNACTYVGSAIFTYGVAVLANSLGWRPTVGIWFIIGICGVACCFMALKAWRKFVLGKDGETETVVPEVVSTETEN